MSKETPIATTLDGLKKEIDALKAKKAEYQKFICEIDDSIAQSMKAFQDIFGEWTSQSVIVSPVRRSITPRSTGKRGPRAKGDGKMSAKDAVLKVITDSKEPITVDQIKDAVSKFGKWSEAAVNGSLNLLRNKEKTIKAVTRGVYAVK